MMECKGCHMKVFLLIDGFCHVCFHATFEHLMISLETGKETLALRDKEISELKQYKEMYFEMKKDRDDIEDVIADAYCTCKGEHGTVERSWTCCKKCLKVMK